MFHLHRFTRDQTNRVKREERQTQVKQIKQEFYENEKKLVAEKGKKPYFLKDCKPFRENLLNSCS
jgi:hypothetical protein